MKVLTLHTQPPKLTLREHVEEIDKFLERKLPYDQLAAIGEYDFNPKSIKSSSLTVLDTIDFAKDVTHVAAHYLDKRGVPGRFFTPVRGSSEHGFNKLYSDIKSSLSRIVFIAGVCPNGTDVFDKTQVYLVTLNEVFSVPLNRSQGDI